LHLLGLTRHLIARTGLPPVRLHLAARSPLFPQITVVRSNGATLTINAVGAAPGRPYVQSLTVDGQPSSRPWLPESVLTRGGRLDFTLGASPNTSWGAAPADAPPSFR
jgi:putative alpha-1,2-mannosidase